MAVISNSGRLNEYVVYDSKRLLDFIDDNYVKLTPDMKLNSILEYIGGLTSYDGQILEVKPPNLMQAVQMYFNNLKEWRFYLDNAVAQGLLKKKALPSNEHRSYTAYEYSLTVDGLTKLITVSEGKHSHYCFIAMAFVDEMFEILNTAIKPALMECGFIEFVVSDQQVDSDKTLNDAILAGIKKSRFTIADFTYHRGGVYFEAGYALGRGQKVIYTCRSDEMSKSHFDIRNYQHIVWNDAADFMEKLKNKIEAFIKD
jgi:nucleoside 2-deoxyribosyltransferase